MESKKIRKRIWNDKILVLCLFFLLLMGLMALMAPVLAPNNPDKLNLTEKFMAPCVKYPLGTDNMGRCMLSRILYGARPTMGYAVLVTLIASVIGTLAGMASGFLGGKLDYIIMRLCDILRAFPGIVVVMIMVSLFGVGIHNVCLSMLFTRWIWYARVSRNMTKAEKERTSVMASILAGSNSFQILLHNILPAILPQMLSVMTINFGSALLSISSYSFLGLGVQPPTAEWGMMISDGKSYISTHSSMMFWPGLCILLAVLAANISGDRLRDILEENRT